MVGGLTKNALTAICSVLLTLLLAEGVLHFFPVNEGLRTQPVNEQAPIAHFEPNRTSTWSRFADLSMVNEVHSNNYGFINDQDYTPDAPLPLVAIIGDSYVEAAMVPYAETIQGRLASAFESRKRVYSFGMSGAPLSQYLAYARFVRDEFRPAKMVFVIVGNDFDESLLASKTSPGFHSFAQEQDGGLALQRIDYTPSTATRLLRQSKLAMYLITNTQALQRLRGLTDSAATPEHFVGQTAADADSTRLSRSRTAAEFFLKQLPTFSGLAPHDILFVVDALRPHLYTEAGRKAAQGSYADHMRQFFMQAARQGGFGVLDIAPVFLADYATNHCVFEYPKDGHWNGYAHEIVARALQPLLEQ